MRKTACMRRNTPLGFRGTRILSRNWVARTCVARTGVALAIVALSHGASSVQAQGNSDIFVASIHQADGRVGVDGVTRVTNEERYSNQPAFLRDGTLVFTRVALLGPEGQADIWMVDPSNGVAHPFTKTSPESEYSAYQIPGSSRIAVIRVEADSTQRLWSFGMDGMDFKPVLTKLKPIGYQAWVDPSHVAVFVLGDAATRAPSTLQLVDVRDESSVPVATGIGRALQTVPGRAAVSFTVRDTAKVRWIDVYDVASRTTSHVAKSLPQNEYHVWLSNGMLISAQGSSLYQLMPGKDADWVLIADLADKGVKNISRLAVSEDGKKIAMVAAH